MLSGLLGALVRMKWMIITLPEVLTTPQALKKQIKVMEKNPCHWMTWTFSSSKSMISTSGSSIVKFVVIPCSHASFGESKELEKASTRAAAKINQYAGMTNKLHLEITYLGR